MTATPQPSQLQNIGRFLQFLQPSIKVTACEIWIACQLSELDGYDSYQPKEMKGKLVIEIMMNN